MSMTVLKIGFYDFLLPEGLDGSVVLGVLQQALPCSYEYWKNPPVVVIEDKPVELELKVVPKRAKILRKMEGGVQDVTAKPAPRPRPMKAKTLEFPAEAKLLTAPSKPVPALPAPRPKNLPSNWAQAAQLRLEGMGR